MAILAFQKPDKVIMTSSTEVEGEFEFKPLEPGYGITIGNALRRILLSSLEGYAISSVKIQGVDHEFATIKGVMEDVTEIVLNLKQVRFKKQIDGTNTEKVTISVSDKEILTAGDLGKFTSAFQVLNPDQVICRMDSSVKLKMDITIVKGRGYVPAEENKPLNAEIGMIPIDSIFTPIKNVRYTVENFRVEQKTDYEKLLLTVVT
ncbi:MAG TPA: DNA-directed RNA polymerase subunit alpha, partial [Bacteroidia bacterium]|nr:DNA-directed RNA polymerase subunit alpha [Bacteroidia bacterium]